MDGRAGQDRQGEPLAREVEAKRIISEADHEKIGIDSHCRTGRAHQGEAMPRPSQPTLQPSGRIEILTSSSGPTAYDKLLDDKTTIFLPATPTLCGCCTSTSNRARSDRPLRRPEILTGADLLQTKTEEEIR